MIETNSINTRYDINSCNCNFLFSLKRSMLIRFWKSLFVMLMMLVNATASAQNIDINILESINPEQPNSSVWNQVGNSSYYFAGAATVGTLAYGFLKKDKKLQQNGYALLVSLATNFVITEGLKSVINRARPADAWPGQVFVIDSAHGKSFPSGHTSQAFALATTLSFQYKKWYVILPAYLWATSVGYSRMYQGKHYPSDVLGGALVGVGSAYLGRFLNQKIFQKKKATSKVPQ